MRTPPIPARRAALLRFVALVAALAAALLTLAACAPLPGATPAGQGSTGAVAAVVAVVATPQPLIGSTWILTALDGQPPLPGSHLTITFAQSEFSGFGGCNRFGGRYGVERNYVRPDTIQRTLEGCLGEGILEQERAYVDAVQAGGQFRLDGDRLEILDQAGQVKLAFMRQAEWPPQDVAALFGTTWRLMTVNGTAPLAGSTITLAFVAQDKNEDGTTIGRAFGSAGCRAYEAEFEADARRVWFPVTRMLGQLCASSDLLRQEGEYTTMLGWLDRYRVDGETLELHTQRGEVLHFARVPADTTPTPLPPTPTPAASPAGLGLVPRFQWTGEDWSFVPPPSLKYVRRGGFPPNIEFQWRVLPDEEERSLPGQLTLIVTSAPDFTVEEWLEVNDHAYALVHRKTQRAVNGRPAWQIDWDSSGPGFLAGTLLVIQNGEDVLAFLVLTSTWEQYLLHADEIETMFATIEFIHATPVPHPTPRFEGLGFVETTTRAPDGEWIATAVVATPNAPNIGRYYRGLKVAQTRGQTVWQPLDAWERFGFGYLSPRVVKWSNDGRYLYFTNLPQPDGCAPAINGGDLQRLDLSDGSVTEIMPARARWLTLSPDDKWLAYLTYQPIRLVLHDLATGAERRLAIVSDPANAEAAPLVWSPDSRALVFTLAPWGCAPEAPQQRVVRLDLDSLAQTVLFEDDHSGYVATKWPEPHKLVLEAPGVPPLEIDPAAKLPGPVADFLRTATPVPALPAPEAVRLEMLRLFNTPPFGFLTLESDYDDAPFDLSPTSIPADFSVDSIADNADHTLRAVNGFARSSDWESYQLYVITLANGTVRRVEWETYVTDRPIQEVRWLGKDILVFSQWVSPRGGSSWALDMKTQKVAAMGIGTSPELAPPIEPQISDEPLQNDPRTPAPPELSDNEAFSPSFTPDAAFRAQLNKEGRAVFDVGGYTFGVEEEHWLPPYMVRLWQSDTWENRYVTISALGQPTIQIDSVWHLTVHKRPGIVGEDAPSVEIVAGPPTGEGGFTTLLYSLAKTPRLVLQTDFGPPGSFEDLDGDGVSEFVLTEPPCARHFCDNPAAVQSSTIYRYTGHGWAKANERFAARLAEERSRNEQLAARATPGPPLEFTDRPRCAVYVHVADLLHLGRVADARQALQKYYQYPDAEEFWLEINQSMQGCVFVRPLNGQ